MIAGATKPEQVRANAAAGAWEPSAERARGAALALAVLAEIAAAAALVCLDPGHGTAPEIGRQVEPIGPGSAQLKIKDPGGAAGEAPVALAIARRTRALLLARGYRVAMTRTSAGYRGGNRERARFCNARRRRADDPDPRRRLEPTRASTGSRRSCRRCAGAGRATSTAPAAVPAGSLQQELVAATGARDLGVVERADLTGFNWADVPGRARRDGVHVEPARGGAPAQSRRISRSWRARSPRALSAS